MAMRAMGQITSVVFHHSASPRGTTVEQIRKWHVEENGWDEIGYHFVIDGRAQVHRCRPIWFQGAHVREKNRGRIGICIVGNNTKPRSAWTSDQIAAANRLLFEIEEVVGPVDVFGHRELDPRTQCPGVDVEAFGFR